MNKQIVARELERVAGELEIIAAKAEVPSFIWESLKKIFGMKRDASTVAKLMVKTDADGNPVGSYWKCKAMAIGYRSLEKKLEELGHPEIKLTFSGVTFDDNAKKLGIPEEEYTKTVEPPQNIVDDIIKANAGEEVEYKKRAPGSAASKVNLEEVEGHAAFKEFKEKFLDVLGDKISFKVTKSGNEMDVIQDDVDVTVKNFDVTIKFQLITKGDKTGFYLIDWTGPAIETELHYRSMRSMDELSQIASDINNAKFKGSIYTTDGKNVLTLTEDELKQYFMEDSSLSLEKKIEILKARLAKGKKDKTVATIVFDSMPKDENDVVQNTDEAATFLSDFINVINWSYISRYINLPEAMMIAFADKLDWKWISTKGNLSDSFIKQFADKLNIQDVLNNQNLSGKMVTFLKRKNLI